MLTSRDPPLIVESKRGIQSLGCSPSPEQDGEVAIVKAGTLPDAFMGFLVVLVEGREVQPDIRP